VTPSRAMYAALHTAFDFFNDELFGSKLPPVMLLVHRKKNAHGYFWSDKWAKTDGEEGRLAEIAMNPETMGRTPTVVLSTLVHEMAHHWDFENNEVPKSGHGKLWAAKMDELGLTPTSTGAEGGKRTGRKVTHMIVDGGPFAVACAKLLDRDDLDMSWFSPPAGAGEKKQDKSKVKHTCPDCQFNAWFKAGGHMVCGSCEQTMVAQS